MPNTPKARNIVADSNHEIKGATLLTFDVKATKDNILMDTLTAQFTDGAGGAGVNAIPTTAYLYDDSGTAIGTGTPYSHTYTTEADRGKVTFSDLNYTISRDTTKTFTIRIDDTLATPVTATHISDDDGQIYTVAIAVGGISGEKSNGTTISSTGSATSYNAYAYAEGPIFTIASISTSATQKSYDGASSTLSATFNIQVQAVSGDVYIPNAATKAFTVSYGKNSASTGLVSSVTYVQPSGTTVIGNYYKVGEGTTATFAVGATYTTSTGNGDFYDLRVDSITWRHIAAGAIRLLII